MILLCRGEELKQCKTELDSLKVTNKKLTSTLQESMAKANDWHKKLNSYKEENDKYQKKVKLRHKYYFVLVTRDETHFYVCLIIGITYHVIV